MKYTKTASRVRGIEFRLDVVSRRTHLGAGWLLSVILIGFLLSGQNTRGLTLSWDPSADPGTTGYNVYWGEASGSYSGKYDVGTNTSFEVPGMTGGKTYYFVVTAYDSGGLESPHSHELSYLVPATAAPPTIYLTAPSNGASFAAPASLNLAATILANGHSINTVRFYNGPSLLSEVASAPYNFIWNQVMAGNYDLSATLVYDGTSVLTSSVANVAVTNPVPVPWHSADIGVVGLAGTTSYDAGSGLVRVEASGADIWGASDAFRFVWQPVSGDCEIRARVTGIQAADGWAKSGVMIRETLSADSAQASMLLTLSNSACFEYRPGTGTSSGVAHGPFQATPCWVRVVRAGNTFTGFVSPDGSTWTQVGAPQIIPMAVNVYIGLCCCAHDTGSLNTSTFDDVLVPAGVPPAWQSDDVGVVGLAGTTSYDPASGMVTVESSGSDIWGTSDGFRFVWQSSSGDCEVRARVGSLQAAAGWAKAGVMIRETLDANSAQASMLLTLSNSTCFEYRPSTGASCGVMHGQFQATPYWVRLTRVGNTFTGFVSPDGSTWTQIGAPQTISMATNVYVGLCSCAHSSTAMSTSTFANTTVSP